MAPVLVRLLVAVEEEGEEEMEEEVPVAVAVVSAKSFRGLVLYC